MTIVISDLTRHTAVGSVETSVVVAMDGERQRLSIRHAGDVAGILDTPPAFDAFAVLLLIPAMARRMPLIVEGTIDARRLDAMRRGIQTLLSRANHDWHPVDIEAEARTVDPTPDLARGTAMGMSCGIDSLYTFLDLARAGIAPHLKVKLLMHNDVGAHPDRSTFERHLAHVRRFADEFGLPLISTTVDLSRYYHQRFIHSHTLRNAGAAMSLEPLFSNFIYPAGDVGQNVIFGRNSGIAPLDPSLLPLLNTGAASYLTHGMHIERLGKTAAVMRTQTARKYLTVCTHGFRDGRKTMNCGRCYKCARILHFAEAHGMLGDFRTTFDLENFERHKQRSLFRLFRHSFLDRRSRDDQDLLAYLVAHGYPMPAWLRPFRRNVGVPSRTDERFAADS